MDIQALVLDAPGDVNLDHRVHAQLPEERGDVQGMVRLVTAQVVHVEHESAAGGLRERVEEAGRGVLLRVVGQQMDHVLQQERHLVPPLDRLHTLDEQLEHLPGSGNGQHRR